MRAKSTMGGMARRMAWIGAVGALAWMVGCVGRTESGGTSSDGPDAGEDAPCGVGGCVDVPLSKFDTSCNTSADCVAVTTGHVCPGQCLCGGTSAINIAAQSDYQQTIASVALANCFCPEQPSPQCIAGTCTMCTGAPGDPPSCQDGGLGPDSGVVTVDASADVVVSQCVDIPASTYTTACNVDSDCTLLPEGSVCTGQCECGGSPVNVSGQAAFEQATAGIQIAECPCAAPPPVRCVAGACTQCSYGPGGNVVCGDGG